MSGVAMRHVYQHDAIANPPSRVVINGFMLIIEYHVSFPISVPDIATFVCSSYCILA